MGRYKIGEHFHKFGIFEDTRALFNSGKLQARLAIRNYYQAVHGVKISKAETIENVRVRILAKGNKPKTGMEAMKR